MAETEVDLARVVRVVLTCASIAGAGFAGGNAADVFEAQEWKQENVERLMQAERDRDRLVALEAQSKILIRLVERCSGGTDDLTLYEPEEIEAELEEVTEALAEEPGMFEWMSIQ